METNLLLSRCCAGRRLFFILRPAALSSSSASSRLRGAVRFTISPCLRCHSLRRQSLSKSEGYCQKQQWKKRHIPFVNEADHEIQEVCHEKGPRFFLIHIPVQKPQYPQRYPERQALHQTVKLADLIICHSG